MAFLKHIVKRSEDAHFLFLFCLWKYFQGEYTGPKHSPWKWAHVPSFSAVLAKCLGVFLVAAVTPACTTWTPTPTWRPRTAPSSHLGLKAWPLCQEQRVQLVRARKAGCTLQKYILLASDLSLLFRLTRNGRSFPRLLRPLSPERKVGRWWKCPWRNAAPPRGGFLRWTRKCTRWLSALGPYAELTGSP